MHLSDPTLLKSRCMVDGRWTGATVAPVANPATGETLALAPHFWTAQTTQAIAAASRDAFENPQYGPELCMRQPHLCRDASHDIFVAKLKAGDGMEAGVTQGTPNSEKVAGKVEADVAGAACKGATAGTGGKRHVFGGTCFEEFLEMNYLLPAGI